MLKIKVIGTGAAGGKAVINLVEKGIISENQIMIINSTAKDIPEKYKNKAVLFANSSGCAKERHRARELAYNALKQGSINIDGFFDPDDKMCVIVTSIEGGTGSGSSTVFADYIQNVLKLHVVLIGFTGFETDVRGMANTIEFMRDLDPEYTVKIISNKRFLDGNNILKAELAANDELVKRLNIIIGKDIIDSDQNIDNQDLLKVSSTAGYMYADKYPLIGIKNVKDYNNTVSEMLDNNTSLDVSDKSIKRLAVILNIKDKTKDFVDFNHTIFKERFGVLHEIYLHVQYDGSDEYISYIAGGMHLPIEEVQDIYNRYKEGSDSINKSKDDFFDFVNNLKGNDEDIMFDMKDENPFSENIDKSKKDFFSKFNQTQSNNSIVQNKESKFINTEYKVDDRIEIQY